MPKITVIENECANLWYYPEKKIVHHKIHKFIYGETFYNLLLAGTDLLQKNHACKWLSDDRDVPVLRQEDMDWGVKTWVPKNIAAGWKYWAIVQPEKPMGQVSLNQVVKNYSEMGITARFFTDLDEAMRWLESL